MWMHKGEKLTNDIRSFRVVPEIHLSVGGEHDVGGGRGGG